MLSGQQETAGGGTICIPVYVGGTLLDEVVVDMQADSGDGTEAGATQRDMMRMSVVSHFRRIFFFFQMADVADRVLTIGETYRELF